MRFSSTYAKLGCRLPGAGFPRFLVEEIPFSREPQAPGTRYPATLVTTSDHDDRVFPAHSFKYAATLQEVQAGDAPILIRIETKAGHGAGKPTAKVIQEQADIYGFLVKSLGVSVR